MQCDDLPVINVPDSVKIIGIQAHPPFLLCKSDDPDFDYVFKYEKGTMKGPVKMESTCDIAITLANSANPILSTSPMLSSTSFTRPWRSS